MTATFDTLPVWQLPLWIFLALITYGFTHSLLASAGLKRGLRVVFGRGVMRVYRLFYTLWATLTFLPVLYLLWKLPDALLYRWPAPWDTVGYGAQIVGLALGAWSLLVTDVWAFVGLKQLGSAAPDENVERFTVEGPYTWVRHPMYTSTLLILWGAPSMSLNRLAFTLATTLYFIVGGYFEERKLLVQFGEPYAAYRRRTPMLLPLPKRKDRS